MSGSPDTSSQAVSVEDITVTEPNIVRRAIVAAATGNVTEWYDFGVYAYLEPTIGKVFFSGMSSTGQTLAVAGSFAASFLVRPLGGLFFGPLGDRIGRTKVLSITMIVMALGTFGIGVLPSYASVGIAAAMLLLLCRLVQGFSTGGEYGGAMTFIAEYSPDRRRGFLGSWLEFGTLTGYAMGATLVTVLGVTLSEDQMLSWGWRVPFFIALPLGIVGLYLRARLEETPAFAKLTEESEGKQKNQTFIEFLKSFSHSWRAILVCIGLVLCWNVTNYMLTTFVPTYLATTLPNHGVPSIGETTAQVLQIVMLLALMLIITFIGRLSDRVGRRPIVLTGCALLVLLSFPAVYLLRTGDSVAVFTGLMLMGVTLICFSATLPSTLPALFKTGIRYGTLSIAFNISVSAFGGTTQTVNETLISLTGDLNWPAYYLMGAGVIGAIAILCTRESNNRPLPGSHPSAASAQEARELVAAST
jgi:MHS family proline/betaine transporter-like MFS transporter